MPRINVHTEPEVCGSKPVFGGKIVPSAAVTVAPETAERLSEFRLQRGDIILGRRGEMGRCAVVREAEHVLRMRVERTFAWEDKFKRLLIRFERIQRRHYGMLGRQYAEMPTALSRIADDPAFL